jgi:hypothetical protein
MTSFANSKQLRFVITLGTGTFGNSSNNVITLEGFRARVNIDKAGGMQMGTLRASIFGVSQSDMNSITTLQWKPRALIFNTLQVYTIDGDQTSLIFQGNIVNAWPQYQNQPDVFLMIQAQAAYFNALKPVAPRSFQGAVDVANVMSQIAASMGLAFENNGVSVQLNNTYLANADLEQAKTLARAAGVNLYIDDTTLAITPYGGFRSGQIPEIGPNSGLDGFPTFDGVGVNFQCLFNPAIIFGGRINLVTSVKQAAGQWIVTSIAHTLDSESPDGNWFSTVRGNANGLAIVS